MGAEHRSQANGKALAKALQALPVLDDPYLRMQAFNLGLIDNFLMDAERQLLQEYIEIERTPMANATFVSAISQLWIFGVYELLRTWRQRVREVLKFAESLNKLDRSTREKRLKEQQAKLSATSHNLAGIGDFRWPSFKRAAESPDFVERVQLSFDSSERIFRRIEILRVHLAKHELHGVKSSAAFAPGYGRIHMDTGTMYYQIALPGTSLPGEVDVISRRDVADGCRDLSKDKSKFLIPAAVRVQLKHIPEWSYGVKCVRVTLADGRVYGGVLVNWNTEIIGMKQQTRQPFDAREIVRVLADSVRPSK